MKIRSFIFLIVFAISVPAGFCAPTVSGTLSKQTAKLDETVSLSFVFDGVSGKTLKPPETVPVKGLDITYTSINSSYYYSSTSSSESATVVYSIVPTAPGTFEIPSLTFIAGDSKIVSEPLKLTVLNESNPPPALADPKTAFARLILPTRIGIVGQPLLMALRVSWDSSINNLQFLSQNGFPQLKEDGFNVSKPQGISGGSATYNGRNYIERTFLYFITPSRPGKLVISPAVVDCGVQKLAQNTDPLFTETLGSNPLRPIDNTPDLKNGQHIRIISDKKEIEVIAPPGLPSLTTAP